MARTIEVNGERRFRISIPDDAELTFGPWSPPTKEDRGFRDREDRKGTLRVYSAKKAEILAVFAGVTSFRDLSRIGFQEEIAKVEVQTLWKDDEHGLVSESKSKREKAWIGELEEGGS